MITDIELIAKKLLTYLRQQLDNSAVDYVEPLTQLQGGFETQTYRFQLSSAGNFMQPLVLRLYPEFYGSANAVWEKAVQDVLHAAGYPVAKPHLLCEDLSLLGGAFFIMDFLPGIQLVNAPIPKIPLLLGKTHAALHQIDPAPLIKAFTDQGISEHALHFENRFTAFVQQLKEIPELIAIANWLDSNKPPVPKTLVICHGDFHPLNILVQEEKVSAVLDWPGLSVGDPVMDVANTIVLSTIPFEHLAPMLGMDITGVDFKQFAIAYLQVYLAERPTDTTHLAYYRVRRCVKALLEGLLGQQMWQHPMIVKDLLEYIHSITGIQITIPG